MSTQDKNPFDTFLDSLRENYGIKRIPNTIIKLETGLDGFFRIADAMLEWKGKSYDRASMKPYVKQLILWALGQPQDRISLVKGFLYKGGTGKGKTFMLQVFQNWLKVAGVHYKRNGKDVRMELKIANARTIAAEYSEKESGGSAVIMRYSSPELYPMLLIDDIGAESREQNSYGNRVSVVNEILDKRQEQNLLTFGTTNLDKLTPEMGYDDRMRRRVLELFNVVSVTHDNKY